MVFEMRRYDIERFQGLSTLASFFPQPLLGEGGVIPPGTIVKIRSAHTLLRKTLTIIPCFKNNDKALEESATGFTHETTKQMVVSLRDTHYDAEEINHRSVRCWVSQSRPWIENVQSAIWVIVFIRKVVTSH
ncbi:hypothetical protein TNCT_397771 [Trichonephila clavata]|uniref:Uncharacterized protein n=1 Tax=Trichonephila clavata TaxID=2740835 RepID=A0A8X6J8T0_TRICU|nr:hypothetical protein TNCT_397771 [Trichonephila clavata]